MAPLRHVACIGILVLLGFQGGCAESGAERAHRAAQAAAYADSAVERGRYLVEGLLQCMICHSERDWEEPGAPPLAGRRGAGRILREEGDRRIVASNLTPDPETGIGRWSDGELARAIRRGIGRDGRALHPLMYFNAFRHLSDADVAAVIAYLRSLDPVRNPLPPTRLPEEERRRLEARRPPALEPVDLTSADPVERGRALVMLGDCHGCHTAWTSSRNVPLLAGGNLIGRGDRAAFSANITPHPTGMPYGPEAFLMVMRTGKQGALDPLMPWVAFRNLSDRDLLALHAFLRTRDGVAHRLGNRAEPTYCEVCGQVHGLGALNDSTVITGTAADPSSYERYAGTYVRTEEPGDTFSVEAVEAGLVLRMGRRTMELTALSAGRFRASSLFRAPVRFERDRAGQAMRVVYEAIDPVVFARRVSAPDAPH